MEGGQIEDAFSCWGQQELLIGWMWNVREKDVPRMAGLSPDDLTKWAPFAMME